MNQLLVPKNQSGIHLKTFLMQWGLSASYWKALKKARALFVNGLVTVWDIPLSANDRVSFPFLPEETDLVPEEGPLTILYEDEVLLAVHKEQGLLVHNSGLTQESSLSRRVLFYYRERGIKAALHPVSRLDRETSGIVLFAKNAALHHMLTKAPMKKLYLALSHGPWEKFSGVIAQPIARKDGSLIERCVAPQGKPARTRYRVLWQDAAKSVVAFHLYTGRTHQIRVHAAFMGHPLLGDTLYGAKGSQKAHALHAMRLQFRHPLSGKDVKITDPSLPFFLPANKAFAPCISKKKDER